MASRRQFIAGMMATGLVPQRTWADAGAPSCLSAAGLADGRFVLCGIGAAREILFQLPLPGRGHAAAAHPRRPEAVAFARRPGTFALVIDCATGAQTARLDAPQGRHFYGHGAFSADGRWLYTTENDYEAAQGRIGVWDAAKGYVRVGEFSSGGVGPHEIRRLPGSDVLVVANGGIETHPSSGRTKLNIPTMQPNLSYLESGEVVETVALDPQLHRGSIRHLALGQQGQVAFGLQWQDDPDLRPLVGLHQRGGKIRLSHAPQDQTARMQGYVGSIAISRDQTDAIVTSPRGGVVQFYDIETGAFRDSLDMPDVCGVAPWGAGVLLASGTGDLAVATARSVPRRQGHPVMWDNHLVTLDPFA